MARYNRNFLHGILGPFVFRQLGNRQLITSKVGKGKMKQTANTKAAGKTFGMASKLGAQIRGVFENEIYIFRDTEMHSRLSSELNILLARSRDPFSRAFSLNEQRLLQLRGFEFNLHSPLKKYMIGQPNMNLEAGKLFVTFAGNGTQQLLDFPNRAATHCEIIVSVALFRLAEGMRVQIPERDAITVSRKNNIAAGQSMEFDIPDGCYCIATIFLEFFQNSIPLNGVKLNPGAICYTAITPGDYTGTDSYFWIDMLGLKFK